MTQKIHTPTLLIAMPTLMDPHFQKSVVLLVEHNKDGAMGFIVNRPSPTMVKDILYEHKGKDIPCELKAWVGGPIESDNGLILHAGPSDDRQINLTSSPAILQEMIQFTKEKKEDAPSEGILYPYRFLTGYAGWGPLQLDEELRLGAWIEAPCSNDILFNCKWESIWEESLAKCGAAPNSLIAQSQPFLN